MHIFEDKVIKLIKNKAETKILMNMIYEQHLLLFLKFYNEYGCLFLSCKKNMSENLIVAKNNDAPLEKVIDSF